MNAAEVDPPEEWIVSCPTLFEKTFFQWPHERTQISTFSFQWLASNDWPSSFLMLRTCRIYWKSYTYVSVLLWRCHGEEPLLFVK